MFSQTTTVRGSLVAQLVKNPPAVQETWVRSLGWEDPLEKGTATHSSILAWRIPWTTGHVVTKSQTQLNKFVETVDGIKMFRPHTTLRAQLVKNLLAMWETWVQSLGWEDPLEKGSATHSSILAWRVHGVAKSRKRLSDFH